MYFRNKIYKVCFLFVLVFTLSATDASARVYTGLELFLHKYTSLVKGKRVGLLTNQTGVNGHKTPTIDLFYRHPGINLVALFAPEHGIRGKVKAGKHVSDGRDPKTGIKIYSLYGRKDHKPTKEMLSKIDVMVYDIQDLGSRAYTYIWHLAECMSACGKANIPIVVLDRPNPLTSKVVDGPITEKQYISFIGLYPIPRVYGMTVGELARYLKWEERINCKLYIVPMVNYRRGMSWKQTGLPWIAPSPNIPSPESGACFAATGSIGEVGVLDIGIGTKMAFQLVGAPWINCHFTARELNKHRLPGVLFVPASYKKRGKVYRGVWLKLTNPSIFQPSTTEVAILTHLKKYYKGKLRWAKSNAKRFDKAVGTSYIRNGINAGRNYRQISSQWIKNNKSFIQKRKKYLIYR